MHWLFQYQFWMGVVAGLCLLRQLMVILAAEQGRKHDLVKKLYRDTQEFRLSILVPFLDPNDHPSLLALMRAIAEQDYPATKVTLHIVTAEETRRELVPQTLRPNVRVWNYSEEPHPRYEQALTWLIDRCLAAGGNSMFVFLRPTDIIKPDFFQNIVSRGLDSFAIQGYVALKNPPETPLAKALALSTRLFNRIGNAGRYHLGLSCRLLDSGWAIKQEVLEMIPYRRGMDLDNLEYTLRLNLENFRVNWAPNVVVYADSNVHFLDHATLSVGALFNRLRLLSVYGPRLATRMLMRFDLNYLEQLFSIVKPPYMSMTLALIAVALVALQKPTLPGGLIFWSITALLAVSLQVLALVVARGKANDYAAMLFHTPVSYVFSLLSSPVGLFNVLRQGMNQRRQRGHSYRKSRKTRFNEEMAVPPDLFNDTQGEKAIHGLLKKNAPVELLEIRPSKRKPAAKRPPVPNPLPTTDSHFSMDEIASYIKAPKEMVRSVPLSNGKKQVHCTLKTLTTYSAEGQEFYRLTLEYKTMSFSTEAYRILDQAFYELQAKLMSKGLTIVACGSCGNFYNPTADQPGALKNTGVCLAGKLGQEVNLSHDAVTVISPSCESHCSLEQRESIVRQWKESLALSHVPS